MKKLFFILTVSSLFTQISYCSAKGVKRKVDQSASSSSSSASAAAAAASSGSHSSLATAPSVNVFQLDHANVSGTILSLTVGVYVSADNLNMLAKSGELSVKCNALFQEWRNKDEKNKTVKLDTCTCEFIHLAKHRSVYIHSITTPYE